MPCDPLGGRAASSRRAGRTQAPRGLQPRKIRAIRLPMTAQRRKVNVDDIGVDFRTQRPATAPSSSPAGARPPGPAQRCSPDSGRHRRSVGHVRRSNAGRRLGDSPPNAAWEQAVARRLRALLLRPGQRRGGRRARRARGRATRSAAQELGPEARDLPQAALPLRLPPAAALGERDQRPRRGRAPPRSQGLPHHGPQAPP